MWTSGPGMRRGRRDSLRLLARLFDQGPVALRDSFIDDAAPPQLVLPDSGTTGSGWTLCDMDGWRDLGRRSGEPIVLRRCTDGETSAHTTSVIHPVPRSHNARIVADAIRTADALRLRAECGT